MKDTFFRTVRTLTGYLLVFALLLCSLPAARCQGMGQPAAAPDARVAAARQIGNSIRQAIPLLSLVYRSSLRYMLVIRRKWMLQKLYGGRTI